MSYGHRITDPICDQKRLDGPLRQVLTRLDELLEINISTATDITSAPREIRHPDYPIVALKQLARNAVMHRNYEGTNAPVRIYWFSDRVEMSNAGGLYGQVNDQNFGDLALSKFEDELSQQWPRCLAAEKRAFRVIGAFYEILSKAATKWEANVVLVDVGPNLGAINRAVLVATHYVVIPLAPDLFSIKGLQNLGPSLQNWRRGWEERLGKRPPGMSLPEGRMASIGYIVMQHAVRLDRPVKAYDKWMSRIPHIYRQTVVDETISQVPTVENDPYCLAMLKHYHSLMPMAQEARKPIFFLKPADGAIGAHVSAVRACYQDFKCLAKRISERCGFAMP